MGKERKKSVRTEEYRIVQDGGDVVKSKEEYNKEITRI